MVVAEEEGVKRRNQSLRVASTVTSDEETPSTAVEFEGDLRS